MLRWIVCIIALLIVVIFIYFKFSNVRPTNLGLTDGALLACPKSPNCVSTQANKNDKEHYIAPIFYEKSRSDVQLELEKYLRSIGMNIVTNTLGYIHAEETSEVIGYIDDIEFYLPEAENIIHIRSASRVGYSDKGVNRKRVEKIRVNLLDI
ncbi:DUF1499 domain-containing protein [Marinomonas agarivorans]|nr:DUF1499 domain-containing protein [Marinomonas agarivorans]